MQHYFSASVIVGPQGTVIHKHWKAIRDPGRLEYATTVHDVLDEFVERYGWDAVWPVARTALDVSIQAQILTEMRDLVRRIGTSLIWISHDLAAVSSIADRIAVMYAGRIVEEGPTAAVLREPLHPYTQGLLDSLPSRT